MNNIRLFGHDTEVVRSLLKTAKVRTERNDSVGASETVRNVYMSLSKHLPHIQPRNITPKSGTEADVITALKKGHILEAIQYLKYIQNELFYGRYQFYHV
ncbi:hypothetical protein L1280_003157 [Deinococcus sp. HSC-46F16]|nr:hypothetical protein [Deinococcus sp. HSC-46F16]